MLDRAQSTSPQSLHNGILSADKFNGIANTIDTSVDLKWNDRIALQNNWDMEAKGWRVNVVWQQSRYGVAAFAAEDLPKGTVLRVGVYGMNMYRFKSVRDVEIFCDKGATDEERHARLMYVQDYLWALYRNTDEHGYPPSEDEQPNTTLGSSNEDEDKRFIHMWVPGNSLNHAKEPNIICHPTSNGVALVAFRDIMQGEEIVDDYRRYGKSPDWLTKFARERQISLTFAGANDFVE